MSRKQEQLVLVDVFVPKDFNETKLFEVGFIYCMLILGWLSLRS